MTHPVLYRAALSATAIVSMAAFAAVFFELRTVGLLTVAMFCVIVLSSTLWVGSRTRRSTRELMAEAVARPSTLGGTPFSRVRDVPATIGDGRPRAVPPAARR